MGVKSSKFAKLGSKRRRSTNKMDPNKPAVSTKYGPVRGTVTYTDDCTRPAYTFHGVPYAAPPTHDKRFRPPEPPEPWQQVRDATELGSICPQDLETTAIAFLPVPIPDIKIDEATSLNLSIYSPQLGTQGNKPVLFWIHGGSFNKGAGLLYQGTSYAIHGDLVVVTINYRLGAFGFLHTGDDQSPGNYGLLDQLAALRWVQENITYFGGDPHNVTIAGESAGAVSVGLLLCSPLSTGLFHKAISQSGSALLPNVTPTNNKDRTYMLAKLLGCEVTDSESVVSFLRQVQVDEFIKAQCKLTAKGMSATCSLDGHVIQKDPRESFSTGNFMKIPHLIGFNSNEGYYFCDKLCPAFSKDNFTEEMAIKFLAQFLGILYPGHEEKVAGMMKDTYFPPHEEDQRKDLGYLRMVCSCALGELFLTGPSWLAGELHSEHAPTYMYLFSHKPSYSRFTENSAGGTHEEELLFSWGDPFMDRPVNKVVNYTESEKSLSKKMIQYWSNFAKTGNPNGEGLVEWPQFDKHRAHYLQLDDVIQVRDHFKSKQMEFCNHTLYNVSH